MPCLSVLQLLTRNHEFAFLLFADDELRLARKKVKKWMKVVVEIKTNEQCGSLPQGDWRCDVRS